MSLKDTLMEDRGDVVRDGPPGDAGPVKKKTDEQKKKERQKKKDRDIERFSTHTTSNDMFDPGSDGERTEMSEEDLKEIKAFEDMLSEETYKELEKKERLRKKISTVILAVVCVYFVMLIFGVILTRYEYGADGNIAPVVMSVDEIQDSYDYAELAGYYYEARSIYEQILMLDYRVPSNMDNPAVLATEYHLMGPKIDDLISGIGASSLPRKYDQILGMINTVTDGHMRSYCKYMTDALGEGNEEAANQALQAKGYIEANFKKITENMISLGGEVKGFDARDMVDWSPEGYVQRQIEGM